MKIGKIFNEIISELSVNNKLKPVQVNRYIYHQSNPIFRNNIRKQGLIPQGKSDAWLSDTKINGKVIFASNSDNKEDWFDSSYNDDIYQIDTNDLRNLWFEDPNFSNPKYVITFEPIPINKIKLIYKGDGKSEDDNISENDTYSYSKGMDPYKKRKQDFINSINTFNDISPDMIPTIIDYFGCEGFNTDEDAIEYLTDKIEEYKNLGNPMTLYRIVGVKNKKMIRTKDIGEHFTPYKWNLDGAMLESIGHDNWDEGTVPYVIVVLVPISIINVWQTIVQNLAFPNEHEINLDNNGKGAKIIETYKLKL